MGHQQSGVREVQRGELGRRRLGGRRGDLLSRPFSIAQLWEMTMSFFLLRLDHPSTSLIWKISKTEAKRVGVHNAEQVPNCYYSCSEDESIWDCFRKHTPWFGPDSKNPFHELSLKPGNFYPRMARPTGHNLGETPGLNPSTGSEKDTIAVAQSQLVALTRQLYRICQTVHPSSKTFNAFGHDIRNLLILACTEVEAHWIGILKANGVLKKRYKTSDYVKLCPAMKLGEYGVQFPAFPWLDPIHPFRLWSPNGNPTQDIPWYDAYNAVKHDRESEFEKATLQHLFEALSACYIMVVAQYGTYSRIHQHSELSAFFELHTVPEWQYSDTYNYPYEENEGKWTAVNYPFSS